MTGYSIAWRNQNEAVDLRLSLHDRYVRPARGASHRAGGR